LSEEQIVRVIEEDDEYADYLKKKTINNSPEKKH